MFDHLPDWVKETGATLLLSTIFEFGVKPFFRGELPQITWIDTVIIGILTYLFMKTRHQTLNHIFDVSERKLLVSLLSERERLEVLRLKYYPDDSAWKEISGKISAIEGRIGHINRQRKSRTRT